MRCRLDSAAAQYERYVYKISSNTPRECEDVPASVVELEAGVVFVTIGLDPGVDEVYTR
jgi:hypothetical protein